MKTSARPASWIHPFPVVANGSIANTIPSRSLPAPRSA